MSKYTYNASIRSFCLDCMGFSAELVANCPSKSCLFYPYRLFNKPYPKPKLSPLQSIHLKCLECVGSPEEVTACSNLDCPIHIYRDREVLPRKIKKTASSSKKPSKFDHEPKQLSLI